MSTKQFILLLILGVVIGGAGLVLYKRDSAGWQGSSSEGDRTLLRDFPLNDVAHVRIKDNESEVNLVRRDGVWTVAERGYYPASFQDVSRLIRQAWELKAVQEVQAGPSQLPRLNLIEPGKGEASGTMVEFLDGDGKRINGLLLGKHHTRDSGEPSPFGGGGAHPVGRYVMPLEAPQRIGLVSETFESVQTEPQAWLDRQFLSLRNIRSIVISPREEEPWMLMRDSEAAGWKIPGAGENDELDLAKTSQVSNVFSRLSFTDVLPGSTTEATGLDQPTMAVVETFDGFVYSFHIGSPDEENYYLRVSASAKAGAGGEGEEAQAAAEKLKREQNYSGWVYQIGKWAVEPLLQPGEGLIKRGEAEAPAAAGVPEVEEPFRFIAPEEPVEAEEPFGL